MNNSKSARSLSLAVTVAATAMGFSPAWAAPVSFTNSTATSITDNNSTGINSVITVGTAGTINAGSLSVTVAMDHTWLGDLVLTLSNGISSATLMNRAGQIPFIATSGDSSNLSANRPLTFSGSALVPSGLMGALCGNNDTVGNPLPNLCPNTQFSPVQPLSVFDGGNIQGNWTLNVSDRRSGNTGQLAAWRLNADVAAAVPEPGALSLVALGLLAAAAAGRVRAQRQI